MRHLREDTPAEKIPSKGIPSHIFNGLHPLSAYAHKSQEHSVFSSLLLISFEVLFLRQRYKGQAKKRHLTTSPSSKQSDNNSLYYSDIIMNRSS